jgi:hypothetical protein
VRDHGIIVNSPSMKFAAGFRALLTLGICSLGCVSATSFRGSHAIAEAEGKEDRLIELANAVAVLQEAGVDVSKLDWGKPKPEPEEQLLAGETLVSMEGVDPALLNDAAVSFLEDALQFAFNKANKGGDLEMRTARFVYDGDDDGNNTDAALSPYVKLSNSRSIRYLEGMGWKGRPRGSRSWTYWSYNSDMSCRLCRDDRLLGSSNAGSSSMIGDWEDNLKKILKSSRFEAFAGLKTVEIHLDVDTPASLVDTDE